MSGIGSPPPSGWYSASSPPQSVLDHIRFCILEVESGKEVRQLRGPWPYMDPRLVLSSDGKILAWMIEEAAPIQQIHMCDTSTGSEIGLHAVSRQEQPVGFTVRLWSPIDGKELHRFICHRDAVTCVAFAPDGQSVISGSRDSTALIWDLRPLKGR